MSRRPAAPSRRALLAGAVGAAGAAGLAGTGLAGCSFLGGDSTPGPRLLKSSAKLPKPFRVPLPIPVTANPSRSTGSTDFYELSQRPARTEILPGLQTEIWGYDGQFPGPTIAARSGRRTVVRVANELTSPTVTHLHGGRTPPESDGYPTDLVKPGAHREYEFPLDQRAATLWYHDHTMDFTGPQVWRGLAGFFLLRDDEEEALNLPSGDRDIPLLLCDRSFREDGSMPYPGRKPDGGSEDGGDGDDGGGHAGMDMHSGTGPPPGAAAKYMGGVLGDVVLVNGAPWPELRVARARYRFRLLNGANARVFDLSLSPGGPDDALIQVGSDGGLLTAPRRSRRIRLAPAERADVVVDFGKFRVGERIELRNADADGPQGRVMRFVVDRDVRRDDSAAPSRLRRLSRIERLDPSKARRTRKFEFASGELHGETGWLINGKPFDTQRMDATPKLGDTEIWEITSDVAHPVHLHLAHFQVLSVDGERRTGPPEWKDTVELKQVQTVEIITRFTGYRGRYVFHCHNLEHEDMAMMANFEVR